MQAVAALAYRINDIRPELDLYLVGHAAIEAMLGEVDHSFRRVFLRQDSGQAAGSAPSTRAPSPVPLNVRDPTSSWRPTDRGECG